MKTIIISECCRKEIIMLDPKNNDKGIWKICSRCKQPCDIWDKVEVMPEWELRFDFIKGSPDFFSIPIMKNFIKKELDFQKEDIIKILVKKTELEDSKIREILKGIWN